MARTPDLALSTSLIIAPSGWALPNDPDSMFGNMLRPMASAWCAIEASMDELVTEIDPRQAVKLLPAWEAMLGPDPCGRDLTALTIPERQLVAYQRLTARGGQSIPYFTALAASLGEDVTIEEGGWCRLGAMRLGGSRFSAPGNQFNWRVTLVSAVVTPFRLGASSFGDRLGSFTTSLAQCPIEDASPAHTNVSFDYSGSRIH